MTKTIMKTATRQECMQMGGGGDGKRKRRGMGNESIIREQGGRMHR
jgi:hypothetical protein